VEPAGELGGASSWEPVWFAASRGGRAFIGWSLELGAWPPLVFVKTNSGGDVAALEAEAEGLRALAAGGCRLRSRPRLF